MIALLAAWTYTVVALDGWNVEAETALVASPQWPAARHELDRQLRNIVRVVPEAPLARLKEVTIWMRLDDPTTPCAAYHPGADWLRGHGTDPAMAKGLELSNAARFVAWTKGQPWMVFHELAHAYHDRILGFDEPRIRAAYEAAVRSGEYERVYRRTTPNRGTERHYALTDPMEYFAETTEAYFGENDFYPFDRAQLHAFDPASEALMVAIWGEPKQPSE